MKPLEVLGKLALPDSPGARQKERGRSRDDDLRPQIAVVKQWMKERADEGEALLARSRSDLLAHGPDEQQAFYLPQCVSLLIPHNELTVLKALTSVETTRPCL